MGRRAVIGLVGLAVFAGIIALAAVPLMSSTAVAVKPSPSGPLKVVPRELSLPDPRGADRPAIAVRIWSPKETASALAYPLIVYIPAWGGSRDENDVLLSDIASEGFVVAALDDVSRDPPDPALDPVDDAVRLAPFPAQNVAAFPEVSERRTRLGYGKQMRLLEALTHLPSGTPVAAIDFSRIGIVGFSFGGAVATVMLAKDPRIAAAVNLDGWVVHTPAAAGLTHPYLALYGKVDFRPFLVRIGVSKKDLSGSRDDFRALLALSRSSGSEVHLIDGVGHTDFSDRLYEAGRWKRWRPWRMNIIQPDRMHAIVEAYLIPFLQEHVAGQTPASSARPAFAEVSSIESIESELQ